MNIEKAKALKVGQFVHCPADRGELSYTGKVEHVGTTVCITSTGSEYVWITVRKPAAHASVWPSNRLS